MSLVVNGMPEERFRSCCFPNLKVLDVLQKEVLRWCLHLFQLIQQMQKRFSPVVLIVQQLSSACVRLS